jgi:Family of unknown function (DUF6011)
MQENLGTAQPTSQTRMGRMLAAGRVTVTMKSLKSGEHLTLTLKCSVKNDKGKWKNVPFAEATHVYITQGDGSWGSNKIATFYTKTGKIYFTSLSPAWRFAAKHSILASRSGQQDTSMYEIREASRCGKCGKPLTDPVSIERGIGPTCLGAETGSVHYKQTVTRNDNGTETVHVQVPGVETPIFRAIVDKKGREVPRNFDALVQSVR